MFKSTSALASSVKRLLVVVTVLMLATGSAVNARSLKSYLNDLAAEMDLAGYDYNRDSNNEASENDELTPDSKVLVPRKYGSQLDQIFEDGSFAGFLNDLKESRAKAHNEASSSQAAAGGEAESAHLTNNNKRAKLVKLINTYTPNKNKKGFQITTLYNVVQKEDGSVLLIPKDSNKNHYFIGK